MRCVIVSHTHWDREWYRTFQSFRSRLVDAVDRVLELSARDPDYRFVLDGQSVVLEDYLEIRPERRGELERAVRAGQVAIGPWYVQPDSLLPSGEAHVRNLLEGRRVAETIGPASRVGYTPDSFGHPAQFPQLYRGFGLSAFVYWRGNGNELDELDAEYVWEGPDGSELCACHLGRGYFAAAFLPPDLERAAERLQKLAERLAESATGPNVLLMNGVDHQLPDEHVREAAESLAKATGWEVERGLLEDFVSAIEAPPRRYAGELVGGRVANLLPGVWSTRTYLKLENRACESELEGWAEPWAALGARLGLADERPALRSAWRELLKNQAHDSICGCSQDRVHDQMLGRYDASRELARETTTRVHERVAGLAASRETPWSDEVDVAVFNPSPHARTDVVRLALDPVPAIRPDAEDLAQTAVHPLLRATFVRPEKGGAGFAVDGEPARVEPSRENGRHRLIEVFPALDVEFVARDVPAFGWRKFRLTRAEPAPERVDDGREITAGSLRVVAGDDGTLDVHFGDRSFLGLLSVESVGDRGDTYDFDPVVDGDAGGDDGLELEAVCVERHRHASGLERLRVERRFSVPARLASERDRRTEERTELALSVEARVAPGVARVDLHVELDNRAEDHRLRLRFPTGSPVEEFRAATTFDVARRRPGPPDAKDWVHPPHSTFPHQGFVELNGLTVVAPGLAEGEVLPDGTLALTLLRATGWLSRFSLGTRPEPAGPTIPTPGAQCPGRLEARLALLFGLNPRAARDAELGLRAVVGGETPLCPPNEPLLEVEPPEVVLSAFKPREHGDGSVVRLSNPTDRPLVATVTPGFDFEHATPVRLDEEPRDGDIERNGRELRIEIPPHALRSVLLSG